VDQRYRKCPLRLNDFAKEVVDTGGMAGRHTTREGLTVEQKRKEQAAAADAKKREQVGNASQMERERDGSSEQGQVPHTCVARGLGKSLLLLRKRRIRQSPRPSLKSRGRRQAYFSLTNSLFSPIYVYRISAIGIRFPPRVTRFWSERDNVLYVLNTTVRRLDSLGQGNVMQSIGRTYMTQWEH